MSKDKNFERRMIVSKYSNRPPFDLKKPKETYGILDRIKEYPVEICKTCCKNRGKNSRNTLSKSHRSLITEDLEQDSTAQPGKNIIPKIIETFEKINPSKNSKNLAMSKNTSIQTLYRNSRACKLGKNIPKHKLMKSLLQNLDSEAESSKKCLANTLPSRETPFSSKGKVKCKKGVVKKQLFSKDEIIRPDFNVSFEKKNNSDTFTSCSNKDVLHSKIDKNTSTTGLVWPPASKEVFQYPNILNRYELNKKSSQRLPASQQGVTSCSTIREECQKPSASQFSSSSFLEEVPTKDVPENNYVEHRKSEQVLRKNITSINQLRQKSLEDSTIHKQNYHRSQTYIVKPDKFEKRSEGQIKKPSPEKLRNREKSFVQTQVEKLNKVMRGTKIPGPKLTRPQNSDGRLQMNTEAGHAFMRHHDLKREETTAKYMGLMDRVRSNVPRIQKSENYESFGSDHGWSDTTGTEINPQFIRFPKETKTAVDQGLYEKKMRIPLSKFTKPHDNFRPAIPARDEIRDGIQNNYFEGSRHKNKRSDCNRPPPVERPRQIRSNNTRKSGLAHTKPTLNLPCKKNLLCDKGEQHSGPCGYTHNHNKVVY